MSALLEEKDNINAGDFTIKSLASIEEIENGIRLTYMIIFKHMLIFMLKQEI